MADVSKIKLPSGTTYNIKDENALPLTGGSVTGPVSFGDLVSIDEATVGDLVVNGSASFTNNLQANTINGVEVGSNPKFTGTVTSVGISNGGGLSVSGSPITSSGTITISHADTSSQASSSNSGRTYIQSLTLDTYGHVTGISTATETVTNTDKKLQIAAVTSGNTYYPIVGTGTVAATREYDTTGFKYEAQTGTTSAVGNATLTLGNSKGVGVDTNKQGKIKIFGRTIHSHTIQGGEPTEDRILTLPNATGTIALTSQIPTVPTTTESATTGITASTTATKTTLGTASSIYGVKSGTNSTTTASKASGSNGSASTWAFEEVSIPNVTAAGSASTWTFGSTTVGDGTLIGEIDGSDSSMLVITAGTKEVQQKTGGANGSAPTLGTAIKVQSKKSGSNGTAPSWSFTDVTVPIRNDSATSVPSVSVASATVSITDPGHTHSI